MKPILYDKTGTTQLGVLEDCINCMVEEERNGAFTLTLTYPITNELHHNLIYDNIIVTRANDEYDNQMFRIITTERIMRGTVTVKAVHISYDLDYDLVEEVNLSGASCEYALNTLFRESQFSTHYRGYSDIVNAQNFSATNKNIWRAIVGSAGSIIDTYGRGPEIIRDNTNIHVLNKRGNDRGVVIEYSVNMLDQTLEVDTSQLITAIFGYATYTDEAGNEITVDTNGRVDSPLINNYSHPFIASKDYSDRFQEGVIPTTEALRILANAEFNVNHVDQPKCNYVINFVPLSKCAGYEDIQDKIHLGDTVSIIDSRYNINTKAKVISYKYNVLLERYDSMELGDAKVTLAQTIINSSGTQEKQDSLEDKLNNIIITNKNYPNTVPKQSVLTLRAGLGTIQADWTFENQPYYSYELYASTEQGFTPTSLDLIYEGQGSSYLHTVPPSTTWYFRVRGKNSYGTCGEFSEEVSISSFIIDENTTYIEKGAIGDAYIGQLSLDRGWVGQLTGQHIDARNLTVTDGNGKRTLNIDSWGNVTLDVTNLSIKNEDVSDSLAEINVMSDQISSIVEDVDDAMTQINQFSDKIQSIVTEDDVKSIIEQSPDEIRVGFNDINNYITINSSNGIRVNHSDGSYSQMNQNGFLRYVSGTGSYYHSLYAGGLYHFDETEEYLEISLPAEFDDIDYQQICVGASLCYTASYSYYGDTAINHMHCLHYMGADRDSSGRRILHVQVQVGMINKDSDYLTYVGGQISWFALA